jgi:hypothetical protein
MPAAALPPARPSGHPSALALHEYHLSMLAPPDAERVGRHVAGCELCRADLTGLASDHRRFDREVLPQTQAAILRRRPIWGRWRLLVPSLGLLAAAATAWLLVVRPAVAPEDILRTKGANTLAIFALRKQEVVPVSDGKTRLQPGDRIRFVLWPDGLRHAVIASVDGSGRATVYHPFGGRESAPLPEKLRVEVPDSIVLDDGPGPERVFAVLAPGPFPTAPVIEALKGLAGKGSAALRVTATLPIAIKGSTQQSILFEKSP